MPLQPENNERPVRVIATDGSPPHQVTEAQLEEALIQITFDADTAAAETPPAPIPPIEEPVPEGMRRVVSYRLMCPHCEEESEWVTARTSISGTAFGGTDARRIFQNSREAIEGSLSWDRGDDNEYGDDINWSCDHCSHDMSFEDIKSSIRERVDLIPIDPPRNRPRASLDRHVFNVVRNDGTLRKLAPSEENYHILAGNESGHKHPQESLPESFSPEVISPYVHKNDPYGYALTATCPECEHSFMVGPEDHSINCPKCSHEFQISPLNRPMDAQNAQERRRRFGASFG